MSVMTSMIMWGAGSQQPGRASTGIETQSTTQSSCQKIMVQLAVDVGYIGQHALTKCSQLHRGHGRETGWT